jgi:hypothetical protein
MPLALEDVRRMAMDAAREENTSLDVVAAVTEAGGSAYAEVLITLQGCGPEECLLSVGVDRGLSAEAVRLLLRERVRAHLHEHGPAIKRRGAS